MELRMIGAYAGMALVGFLGCGLGDLTASRIRQQATSPDARLMVDGATPVCIARPENPGIANVQPLTVSIIGSGEAAQINGGGGACIWVPSGKWIAKLSYDDRRELPGSELLIEVTEPKPIRINICLSPGKGDRVGWKLKRDGEECLGNWSG